MDIATILIGFSELAIAIAGFTTIATVIVRVSDSTTKNLLAVRLKTMLMFSIQLIVVSITPVALYQLEPGSDQIWQWSAMVSILSGAVMAYLGFFYLLPKTISDSKNSWWQTITATALGSASIVTSVVTIIGSNPIFWYMATLTLILGSCLTMLVGLVLSFPVFDVHRK